jgi:lipoprotein-releasing system permease protein
MKMKLLLAMRYLKGRSRYFLSFSNLVAFLGIVVGLFAMLVVSAVMNGLGDHMAASIISTKSEVRVLNYDFRSFDNYHVVIDSLMSRYTDIVAAGPVNHSELLLRRGNFSIYTDNFGVDFEKHSIISQVFSQIRLGMPTAESFRDRGIILGLDMAYHINATIGDTIDVVSPLIMIPTPLGLIPRVEKFVVIGVFHTGLPEFDKLFSYIDIDNSMSLKRRPGVDYIELKTNIKNFKFNRLTKKIENDFPHLRAEHWEIFDKSLYQAIKIEKYAMFVVMSIIIVLASFNITGNFIRTVAEKKEEIAILKTIGFELRSIYGFFMLMGFLLGVAGIFIANFLALVLLICQDKFGFVEVPIPGFLFSAVPVDISITRFLLFSLMTIVICMLGTLYPAYKTMKINIIEVLHEEYQR